jgi:hypothetical protein
MAAVRYQASNVALQHEKFNPKGVFRSAAEQRALWNTQDSGQRRSGRHAVE